MERSHWHSPIWLLLLGGVCELLTAFHKGRWKLSIYWPTSGANFRSGKIKKSVREVWKGSPGTAGCENQDWNQSFWLISNNGGIRRGRATLPAEPKFKQQLLSLRPCCLQIRANQISMMETPSLPLSLSDLLVPSAHFLLVSWRRGWEKVRYQVGTSLLCRIVV